MKEGEVGQKGRGREFRPKSGWVECTLVSRDGAVEAGDSVGFIVTETRGVISRALADRQTPPAASCTADNFVSNYRFERFATLTAVDGQRAIAVCSSR